MRQNDDTLQPARPCPQAEALLAEYHDSVRAYREVVVGLNADLPRPEFESSCWIAEEARAIFEKSRYKLNQHVSAHGCEHGRKASGVILTP